MSTGKHAAPSRLTPKALLGPIRAAPTWEAPYDPFGVQDKQAANEVAEPDEAPPASTTVDAAEAGPASAAGTDLGGRPGGLVLPRSLPAARFLLRVTELAAMGLFGLSLVATARTMPQTAAEAARVVRTVAASRPDVGAIPGTFSQRLVDAAGAAWLSATGALDRHSAALLAAREPMVVAALLALAITWVIGWRLRLSVPTRLAILLVPAASPAIRQLLVGAVRPGPLAGLLIVLAIALIAGPHAGKLSRLAALLSLIVAVVILPAVVPALLVTFAVMLIAGDLAERVPVRLRWAGGVVVVAAALAALQDVRLTPGRWAEVTGGLDPGPLPAMRPLDWILLVPAAALLLAALARSWLREPACATVMLVLTALLLPRQRPDLLAAAIPVGVLVAAANAEDLAVRPRWRLRLRWAFRPAAVRVGLATLSAVIAIAVLLGYAQRLPGSQPAPPLRAVAAWFGSEVAGAPQVAVGDALWPDLLSAGLPPARLVRQPSAITPPWLVTTSAAGQGWVTYASFGTGPARVRIARRQAPQTADLQRAQTENGAALAQNPHLTLTSAATSQLEAGDVDLRVVYVLGLLAGQHTLVITDFPTVPGETPGDPPLRRMLITRIDDRPATDPASGQLLSHWLTEQLDPYRPCQIDQSSGGLLVRYCVAPANS